MCQPNFYEKLQFLKYKKKARTVALFHIFADLFNIWLKRKQPDSLICFGLQSVVVSQVVKFPENYIADS